MFSRKRRFYEKKSFYAAVLTAFIAVFSLSLWLGGDPAGQSDEGAIGPEGDRQSIRSAQLSPEETGDDQRGGDEKRLSDEPDVTVSGAEVLDRPLSQGYFVIEEDGYIRIYQVDAQGQKTVLRTSEILFDLLSKEDQEMFRLGVELQNEDQLMELLQDFES